MSAKQIRRIVFIVVGSVIGVTALLLLAIHLLVASSVKKQFYRNAIDQWDKAAIKASRDYAYLEWYPGHDNLVVEVKIYEYEYQEPYIYTVNKWGRYTVANTQTAQVVAQTYVLTELPEEHQQVFINGLKEDVSYWDDKPKGQAIEFGDGTIYIEFWSGSMLIYSEIQNDLEYRNFWPMLDNSIIFYKHKGNHIYAIGDSMSYIVIDTDTYEVLLEEKVPAKISDTYKSEFRDLSAFSGNREAWFLVSGKDEYPDDTKYIVEDYEYDVWGLGKRIYVLIYRGIYLYEGEVHDKAGASLLKGKLCFYKVKDGLVYAIGDDLTYLIADTETGEVIFEAAGVNRMSDDYAQRLGPYAKEFDDLEEFTSSREAMDIHLKR